jgi:hypothetical protein
LSDSDKNRCRSSTHLLAVCRTHRADGIRSRFDHEQRQLPHLRPSNGLPCRRLCRRVDPQQLIQAWQTVISPPAKWTTLPAVGLLK